MENNILTINTYGDVAFTSQYCCNKKNFLIGWYAAYTGREHGCTVHTFRVHGPCSRPLDTGGKNATVFTGREHG